MDPAITTDTTSLKPDARSTSGLPGDVVNVAPEARHKIHPDEHPEPGRADAKASNGCCHG